MNPAQFQSEALLWIGVFTVVGSAAAVAIGVVIGKFMGTLQAVKERQDRQGARVDTALVNTPAPGQSASAVTVTAPAATTQTVEAAAPAQTTQNDAGGAAQAAAAQVPTLPPAMVPPTGMTEQEAIAAGVSFQPAPPPLTAAAPLSGPSGVSQE